MEPQLVIPLDSTDHASSGWPRILRIVAALSLIFAIVTTVNAGSTLYSNLTQLGSLGRSSRISEGYKLQASRAVLAAARVGIGTVMLVAAFRLRRHGLRHQVLMVTARLWLAIWFLGLILPLYLYRESMLEYISGSVVQAIKTVAFPLLILLILREYSKSHPQA